MFSLMGAGRLRLSIDHELSGSRNLLHELSVEYILGGEVLYRCLCSAPTHGTGNPPQAALYTYLIHGSLWAILVKYAQRSMMFRI